MMKATIIAVGKIKEAYLREGIDEYTKRLSSYINLELIEVADEKAPENLSAKEEDQVREREGERILGKIPARSRVFALDIKGKRFDSEGFAQIWKDLSLEGDSHITMIIGGSLGLSSEVLKAAHGKWSFSALTFPHQLMRLILLEQVYRAQRIIHQHPYHK